MMNEYTSVAHQHTHNTDHCISWQSCQLEHNHCNSAESTTHFASPYPCRVWAETDGSDVNNDVHLMSVCLVVYLHVRICNCFHLCTL